MATDPAFNNLTRSRFHLGQQCCSECEGDFSEGLRKLAGVRSIEVSRTAGTVLVEHDSRLTDDDLRAEAARLGVQLTPAGAGVKRSGDWWRQPKMLALALSGILLLAGLAVEKILRFESAGDALYLAAMLTGGFYPARSALTALRAHRLTISSLLIAAAAGALALGLLDEAAMLTVVFSLGEALEEYVSDRARGSIRQLMALAPPQARKRLPNGSIHIVAAQDLHPGDIILATPGERVASDGIVESGSSSVDQSSVTGESMPVEVARGSCVFGGTLNGNGALEIRVSKEHADTVLARVIHQVEQAQASKGSAQRFADRFGAVYTPAMFALAILLSVLPPLFGGDFREWFYRALVVLTVSCSCGLVISVPVAVVAAISRAARDGILIKGGAYLEALGSVRTVAFDKTGTLTRGRPRLTDVIPARGSEAGEILSLAASVEAASAHPISGAVLEAARSRGITWSTGVDLRSIAGSGIEATVEGRRLFVGKAVPPITGEVKDQVARLEAEGKTVMVLADARGPLGVLAVSDEPRAEAREVVSSLRGVGIRRLVMLTGDNEATAAAVARYLGIDAWHAGLLPEDKASVVNNLCGAEGPIAMIGDGINDAPALATADVGIVMGAAGSDVALETADVALMADDLRQLPQAVLLSRRALTNIRQNIALSLAAVAILVIFALLGWMSLTSGLLLNEGSALLIIANGLRLLRRKKRSMGIASVRKSSIGRRVDETDCAASACCSLSSAIVEPPLAEVARMGVGLSLLDSRFDAPVRQLGMILGGRLAAQSSDGCLPLPDALRCLRQAFLQHGFVDCEVINSSVEDTALRLGRCQEVLGWQVRNIGRSICSFDEGLVEGFLRAATGDQSISVRETACVGEGQTSCQLVVTHPTSGSPRNDSGCRADRT